MKFIHLFFSLLMSGFAASQWNGPDRILCISIYFATALLALTAFTQVCKPCAQAWAIMLCIIALTMSLRTFSELISYIQTSSFGELFAPMSEHKSYSEATREFLGLLIVMLYSIFVAMQFHQNKSKK
jgi:hypothetical protein